MAYAKLTLSDCIQSLADRHDNGTVPTASAVLTKYTRLLNRGVAYCSDRLRMSKNTSLTTSSGTVALPDDFIVVNEVHDSSGNTLSMVDPEDTSAQYGFVYWVTGNQTDGFSLNTLADDTYSVDYSFRPSPMSSNSDVCIIPDIEAVVAYSYAMLRKSESDPFEDSELSLQECDYRLKEMQSAYAQNTDALTFTWI